MIDNVGIIGQGFVGSALREGFGIAYNIETYDKFLKEKSTVTNLNILCKKCEFIFVCVPTPMRRDGSCDLNIVNNIVKEINEYDYGNTLIIKSTVPPGTVQRLNEETSKNLSIVFNPEFLTEANAINDFKNQNRIIIGGPRPATSRVKRMYQKAFPNVPTIKTSSTIAEMVKYVTNTFLATKVSFANEIFQICDKFEIDYDKVIEYARYDKRLGQSHWAVPGPMPATDGTFKYGFSGSCFPKDLNALIHVAKDLGLNPIMLLATWHKNLEVRPEKDWEQLKGRAISD